MALLESALLPGADRDDLIGRAKGEIERIGELIDDVLFLSELESGRAVVALGSIRALPVIDQVVAEAADGQPPQASTSGRVTASSICRCGRGCCRWWSGTCRNAVRYAGPGATCTVSCSEDADGRILRVSDDGSGVPEDDLPRLFERFYRADHARSSRGTGLGLAIVKHVVAAAGGSVEATATSGGGAHVTCPSRPGSDRQPGRADPLYTRAQGVLRLSSRASSNAVDVARLGLELFERFPQDGAELIGRIKELEHTGDDLTHEIVNQINKTFVTPFDRDDIYRLAAAIDDVCDFVDEAADHLGSWGVSEVPPDARTLADIVLRQTILLDEAVQRLDGFKDSSRQLNELRDLEDEGDRLFRDGVGALFRSGADPLMVIRWKDIYEGLEEAVDACENAADVLEAILVKNR